MSIEHRLRIFIHENFLYTSDVGEISDDLALFESGIIDSTGVLELVAFMEQEFQLEVADEELLPEHFENIASLAALVRAKVTAQDVVAEARA